MKNIAIVIYEGCWAAGVFSVVDFFRITSLLEKHLGLTQNYAIKLLSVDGAEVQAASGHFLRPDGALTAVSSYDLIVIPAIEGVRLSNHFEPDPQITIWLKSKRQEGAHLLALTTGVCFVAAAGLAERRLMATHWAFVRWLKKNYPNCHFVAHKSFLQADGIWTTGSMNGGFDALLEMLAQDRGDHFSQLCATHLLVSDFRSFNPILPGYRNHSDEVILKVQDWIESHYAEDLTIERMGRKVGLAERTLKRRFQQATQLSPNVYMQKVRIEKAKRLLLATSLPIKEVAYEVGYENVSFFLRLFKIQVGHTPGQWRKVVGVRRPGAERGSPDVSKGQN